MDERIIAVQKMQNYIEEHIFEEITIDDLANLTMYSPVHVRRLFLEGTKLSPAEYIRRLKLAKAALMLRDESCKVIDVVNEFGFGSVDGFQRAFKKSFGYNPKEYRTNPAPIYLFTPYGVQAQSIKPYEFAPSNSRKVTVQEIHKSARKVICKRGVMANDYWSYCEEVGCDIWGLMKSMKSLDGEPICMWLPEQYRNPITNEYVQGVEVAIDYQGMIPEGFDVLEFQEADYLLFRSDPYKDEEYGSAILDVAKVISEYDFASHGYSSDTNNPRIQLEPICNRGYIEMIAVKRIDATNPPYYSLNQYLQEKYGEKVYKIALNGGMTCPNRDGRLDTRGCLFCSAGGSGDFAENIEDMVPVNKAIELAKERLSAKKTGNKFIAYFQAYTNTYASVEYLRNLYMPVMQRDDIVGLSIGTRPDCLPDEILDLLEELNQIKPVWIELGLQTIHQQTANLIRRGYELSCFEQAVRSLHDRGIDVIVHLIFGLPHETKEDMLASVRYLNTQNIQGVKFQLLHVLKNTDLAIMYQEGKFETLTMEEYIDILADAIACLSPDIVIHRLTGDGPKNLLIAPKWSENKKHVLNSINQKLRDGGYVSF